MILHAAESRFARSTPRRDPCPGGPYVGQPDDIDDERLTDHLLRTS